MHSPEVLSESESSQGSASESTWRLVTRHWAQRLEASSNAPQQYALKLGKPQTTLVISRDIPNTILLHSQIKVL